MFCVNCGAQLMDDDVFCTKCGRRVVKETAPIEETAPVEEAAPVVEEAAPVVEEAAPVVETAPVEEAAPVVETAPVEEAAPVAEETAPVEEAAPVVETAPVEEAAPVVEAAPVAEEAPVKEKKAKKKSKKWLIPVAIIAVLAVVVAACYSRVSEMVIKTISSPEKYYQHVEERGIEALAKEVAASYGNSYGRDIELNNIQLSTGVTIELGDMMQNALASQLGLDDTEWLDKVGVNSLLAMKDDVLGWNVEAFLDKDQLISLAAVLDMDEGGAYLQVPELTKKYIGVDFATFGIDTTEFSEIMQQFEEMYKAFPDQKVVEQLVKKYLMIVVENLDDVEKKTDVLEVGDIEQKCTVLCVEIGQEDFLNIMEAICETAKDDDELLDMIASMAEVYSYGELDADEVRDEMVSGLEYMLEDLESAGESDVEITMNVWVNGNGEVVGRDITMGDEYNTIEAKWYTPQDGKDFELEAVVTNGYESFEIIGKGTKTSTLNGDFVFTVSGMDMVEFTIEDYDIKKSKQGYFDGAIRIKPAQGLWDAAGAGAASMLFADYEILYDANIGKDKSEVTVAFMDDDEAMIKITALSEISSAKSVSVPKKDVVMVEGEEDALEWVGEIDFDEFLKGIKKTKLPDELIDTIEELCDSVEYMLQML